jgi:hypothetical protein
MRQPDKIMASTCAGPSRVNLSFIFAVASEPFADLELEKGTILPYSWSSKRLPVFQGEVVEYQQLTEVNGIFCCLVCRSVGLSRGKTCQCARSE